MLTIRDDLNHMATAAWFNGVDSSIQESKKHLAGLGNLGLGSLITEITANEDDEEEESKTPTSVDSEGEWKYVQWCSTIALILAEVGWDVIYFCVYFIQVGWKALKMQLIILTLARLLRMKHGSIDRPWDLCSPAGNQVILLKHYSSHYL